MSQRDPIREKKVVEPERCFACHFDSCPGGCWYEQPRFSYAEAIAYAERMGLPVDFPL
jgi:hypothetical protein